MVHKRLSRDAERRLMSVAGETPAGIEAFEMMMEIDRICHMARTQLKRKPPLQMLSLSIQIGLGTARRIPS